MDQMTLATAFKMTVALGFVLLTFGIAVWVAKKFSGGKINFMKKGNKPNIKPLEVLAFQSLGPGKNLYLVRCFNRKILVGSSAQSISHIADISEDDEHAEEGFHSTLEEKHQDSDGRKMKSHFGSGLKDISRV